MKVKEIKKGDKILHSHLGTQPPVSGVVMESPVQGRGVRSTILVDVKGSEVGLFDEIGSIYTSQILKVFRDDNWLPVEQQNFRSNESRALCRIRTMHWTWIPQSWDGPRIARGP